MAAGVRAKSYVHWFPLARSFPRAYKIFILWLTSVVALNVGLILFSATLSSPFDRWLLVSRPFTDFVGRVVPALDFATEYLSKGPDAKIGPAFRNCLALNFFLFSLFPIWIFSFALVDSAKNFSLLSERLPKMFSEAGDKLEKYIFASSAFNWGCFLIFYFGPGFTPYPILQLNYLFCLYVFYVLAGLTSLSLMTSAFKIVAKLSKRSPDGAKRNPGF